MWRPALKQILAAGDAYGHAPLRQEDTIQVEYVSANPTGPLHVGHGRGAAYGSALVNLLRAAGYNVQAEYYINDAGNQMNNLAASVNARYLELLGKPAEIPENGYHGHDIIETAQAIIDQFPDTDLDTLEAVTARHRQIDAWNAGPMMARSALERLEEVMTEAGELEKSQWVDFDKLVDNSFAQRAMETQ